MPTNNFSHPSINNSGNYRVRYCRNCGAPLADGANFCGKCGARYEAAQGQ